MRVFMHENNLNMLQPGSYPAYGFDLVSIDHDRNCNTYKIAAVVMARSGNI